MNMFHFDQWGAVTVSHVHRVSWSRCQRSWWCWPVFLALKVDFCWVSVSAVPPEGRPDAFPLTVWHFFSWLRSTLVWSVSAVPPEGRPDAFPLTVWHFFSWLHLTLVCYFFKKSLCINVALIFPHLWGNTHGSASSTFSSQMVLNLHCGFVIFDC